MSGSSRVDTRSEYFHLSSESPCMNFALDPDHPDQEQRWHRDWMERGKAWIERARPAVEKRFAALAAQPDPGLPLVKYDEKFPRWHPFKDPDSPPPWRVGFVGMSGPGMTEVVVAFSSLPTEDARDRLKQVLIADLAALGALAASRKPRFQPPPVAPPPNSRVLLRFVLGILALALTLGYLTFIVPDYGTTVALPVNIGCWIILYIAWSLVFRVPKRLSRVKTVLLLSVLPLFALGHWNVTRAEDDLRKEIAARVYQRLGMDEKGYWAEEAEREKKYGSYAPRFVELDQFPGLIKQIEERRPGWPRSLHNMLGYVDVNLPERSRDERYEKPYWFCATFMGGPLELTRLSVLRVSLRAEDRLLARAEKDRELFLAAWKKKEAEGK